MDQDPDMEMEDMMEETPEYLGHNRKKGNDPHRRTSPGFRSQGPSLVFWGIGLFVLIAAFALFFIGGDKASTEDLKSIRAKLAQLNKRVILLEGTGQKIAGLEDRIQGLQKSVAKLVALGKPVGDRLDRLAKKIDGLQKRMASVPAKRETGQAIQERSISKSERPYHEVGRGETLYRISKKYGISVDELRRLNNLNQNQTIYPGQKLLVTEDGTQ
jgi:septal ring factor EnvC (AmiA/AmiB activator)